METTSTIGNGNFAFTSKTFLYGVFSWMSLGLGLTSLISFWVYSTPSLLTLLINENGITGLGYAITFSPILFVLLMSLGFIRLSYLNLVILFLLYAGLMGASLSFTFLVYTNESISAIFITTAIMYLVMALIGYTTKSELTNLGSILLMLLIGVIIASIVNIFMRSDAFSYVISFISVLLFCGLTAWDIQKLKNLGENTISDPETKSKLGLLGALTLYLDFINLFFSLLRLFGKKKE